MPLKPSDDFGAQFFADAKQLSVHDHMFPSANTGMAWLRNKPDVIESHRQYLQDISRVDIFGVRDGGEIDSPLIAPLRPQVPTLEPGKTYLFETVIRTLKIGHLFSQGTADSNEIWLDVTVKAGDKIIGRSGAVDPNRHNEVDPWSHFVNVFMLDKNGNRIERRNAQDIFTPLYNHQIPPGSAQTVHYEFTVPDDLTLPITVELKLQYRKFDQRYMEFVAESMQKLGVPIRGYKSGEPYRNELPVVTMATDSMTFPLSGVEPNTTTNEQRKIPEWQRWNDYGIGLLLKGKAELRQATAAFEQVERLGRWDGPLNLARVYNLEGRIDEAVAALQRATAFENAPGYPRWTWAWLSGVVNRQQGYLDEAIQNLRSVLEDRTADMEQRGFDFSYDIEVINLLGQTQFDLGRLRSRQGRTDEAKELWRQAIERFKRTLEIDSEDITAHYNLKLLFAELGETELAQRHEQLHAKYKPDDNAKGQAERLAREKYPAANHAAEAVVKYSLQRPNSPGLDSGDSVSGVTTELETKSVTTQSGGGQQ
jgi:tetratricopeptide (TPR) repeat protein